MKDIPLLQGSRYKVHNTLDENDTKNYRAEVAEIWEAGETFDPKTERLFRYLQVKNIKLLFVAIQLPYSNACKYLYENY